MKVYRFTRNHGNTLHKGLRNSSNRVINGYFVIYSNLPKHGSRHFRFENEEKLLPLYEYIYMKYKDRF